jgi:hypothetical protein
MPLDTLAGGEHRNTPHEGAKEKAVEISLNGLYLCRQRPTLPHTFACSNIGPAGLNFRVRDGNGWNPRGKITDKAKQLLAIGCWPLAMSCLLRSDCSTQRDDCCKLVSLDLRPSAGTQRR